MATTPLLHAPERGTRTGKRTRDVHIEHLAQIGNPHVERWPKSSTARRTHENVDVRQLVDALSNLRFIGNI
jgi:hypothetical protein